MTSPLTPRQEAEDVEAFGACPGQKERLSGLKRHTRTLEASPSHRGKNRRKQIGVSLDRDTMAEIDAAADRAGITRTEWIRERLEWALLDLKEGRA